MATMTEMKTCPFCGGTMHVENWPACDGSPAWFFEHDDRERASRRKCPLIMACYRNVPDAVKAWNRRAVDEFMCEFQPKER